MGMIIYPMQIGTYISDFSKNWNPCEWTSIEIWRSSNKKWRPYLGYNKVEKVEKTVNGIVREKNHFNLRKYHHNPYVASNATQKISKRYKNYGMVKWGIVREKKSFQSEKISSSFICCQYCNTVSVGSTKISSSRSVSCSLSLSSSKVVTNAQSSNEESREISRSECSRFLQLVHLQPGPQ